MILKKSVQTVKGSGMANRGKLISVIAGTMAFLLAAAVVTVSFLAYNEIEKVSGERKHTYFVIMSAESLLSDLKDAETGQRGYLLTGDKAFLEPYYAVFGNIKKHLEELRRFTLIPEARKILDAMARPVDDKMTEISINIRLKQTNDMTAVISAISGGSGKRLMDIIRSEVNDFVAIED